MSIKSFFQKKDGAVSFRLSLRKECRRRRYRRAQTGPGPQECALQDGKGSASKNQSYAKGAECQR